MKAIGLKVVRRKRVFSVKIKFDDDGRCRVGDDFSNTGGRRSIVLEFWWSGIAGDGYPWTE